MEDFNVVKAFQGWGKEHKTRTIFQYDNGMVLHIDGVILPETFRADFANDVTGDSKSMVGENSEVEIPYEYFVPGSDIHCWIVVTGDDYSTTVYHILIPVDLRAKPSIEEPSEEQVSVIDQTLAALNHAVEKSETNVTHYPRINEESIWEVWDAVTEEFISTDTLATGATFTPTVSEEGIISWTNNRDLPNPEPVNIKGPIGEQGRQGEKGDTGNPGAIYSPHVSEDGTLSWTNDSNLPNPPPINIKGPKGDHGDTGGYSPKATVNKVGAVTTITITDINGTTSAQVDDGKDGVTFTPTVSNEGILSWENNGNKQNPPSVSIKGQKGDPGDNGLGVPTGGAQGTYLKKASDSDYDTEWAKLPQDFPSGLSAGFHNAFYRGINLGGHVTTAQYQSIYNGTFDDMFVGDYWTINNIVWRIAGFDYWYGFGNPVCNTHHVVIVPDVNLVSSNGQTKLLNSTASTNGGYVGTDFYSGRNGNTAKEQARTIVQNAFGITHILNHKEYLCNAVTNGYESGGGWYDSEIELMSERMIYGTQIQGNKKAYSEDLMLYTIDSTQLPLFAFDRSKINNGTRRWLRDVVSATQFSIIQDTGLSSQALADYTWGDICPVFGIVG